MFIFISTWDSGGVDLPNIYNVNYKKTPRKWVVTNVTTPVKTICQRILMKISLTFLKLFQRYLYEIDKLN